MTPERNTPSARFIVVPPNGKRFQDPDVIRRLESIVRKRLPMHDIEVTGVVQPRLETLTVVARAADGTPTANALAILRALEDFNPDAPQLKPD